MSAARERRSAASGPQATASGASTRGLMSPGVTPAPCRGTAAMAAPLRLQRRGETDGTAASDPVLQGPACTSCLLCSCLLHSCCGQTSGIEVSHVQVPGSPLIQAISTSLKGISAKCNSYLPLLLLLPPLVMCKDTVRRFYKTWIKYFISKDN